MGGGITAGRRISDERVERCRTDIAVNGQAYGNDVLEDAVKAAKSDKAPIELMLKEFDRYRTVQLDYHGGLRYPHLERIEGKPDLLTPILTARK